MTEPRWYTIKEVADRLRVSHDTVTRMIERDELPAIRVSARLVRIPAPALARFEHGEVTVARGVVRRRVAQAVPLGAREAIPSPQTSSR